MIDPDEWFAGLRKEYLVSLPRKMARIEQLYNELQASPDRLEVFEELNTLVHRMHGTAGSYDLNDVAAVSAQFDEALEGIAGRRDRISRKELKKISDCMDRLKTLIGECRGVSN